MIFLLTWGKDRAETIIAVGVVRPEAAAIANPAAAGVIRPTAAAKHAVSTHIIRVPIEALFANIPCHIV